MQACSRQGVRLEDRLEQILCGLARHGYKAWEPFLPATEAETEALRGALDKSGLTMPSYYQNLRLHEPGENEAVVQQALEQAETGLQLGARWAVVNAEPINWSGTKDKNDKQLAAQVEALTVLGEEMTRKGLRLVLHAHDAEMRLAAREFYHMLEAVPPETMSYCLDADWLFKGAGNSWLAVRDIVDRYAARVAVVHLRQCHEGVWAEKLDEGDIDYAWIVARLEREQFNGPVHMEIATAEETPITMDRMEAHRESLNYATQIFAKTTSSNRVGLSGSAESDLLERIMAFELDEPGSQLPFTARLAREQGWTTVFSGRVVTEYKRFAALAMLAGHPVTPSEQVDQAWHLHLLYTRNYWNAFCRDVLGQELHHGPTAGGSDENEKFHDWYGRSLSSYHRIFGEHPPNDIWPSPALRFANAGSGKWVDTSKFWLVPKPGFLDKFRR